MVMQSYALHNQGVACLLNYTMTGFALLTQAKLFDKRSLSVRAKRSFAITVSCASIM